MSELATKSAIMGMVGQILPGLVREKMFDFNACAIEIENEFGLSMTVDEIRLAFAKYELQRTTASDSNNFDDNNEDEEESESEESEEEEYNSYPDRFGNRQRRQQQQQQQRITANVDDDIPAAVSSWLSFDNNQTERKEEKDTEEDIAGVSLTNSNPRAPSTSTNTHVPSNTNTNNNNSNNENNSNGDDDDDISTNLTLRLPNASVMESLIAELAAEKELPNNDSDNSNSGNNVNSNEPKSEMQQVLDILAQPDDPRMHRKLTMQELFGISEEEFNRQLSEVEREHEEQMKREKIEEEKEKQRIADEKKKLSAQATTEDSIRKSVYNAKIKEVFDRVVKVLGIEDEDEGQAATVEK